MKDSENNMAQILEEKNFGKCGKARFRAENGGGN
jgi:hypothetical protein